MSDAAAGRSRPRRPPSDRVAILTAFLRHPARTGTITPSSPALARAMVRGLAVEPDETIVEFGPGTGPFTAEIHRILPDPACYLGIEIEPRLVARLRERYPGLCVVEGSAEHAPQYLADAGRGRVRAVISGLPFASLPPATQDGIVRSFDTLAGPGAEVRTFQYVHSFALPTTMRFLRRMRAVFGPHMRHAVVLRNIPPAVVLRWAR
jgi:phosphatidylethanolamine/phosphatidyl-N-methylethanolamine N-methyltransferase